MNKDSLWIRVGTDIGSVSPCFSKTVRINKELKRATASVSAIGLYNLFINGKKVGDAVLSPGWTSYKNRVQYQSYDVTELLYEVSNEICVICGKGWAIGEIGRFVKPRVYADHISIIADITVEYTDGSQQCIVTNGTWE